MNPLRRQDRVGLGLNDKARKRGQVVIGDERPKSTTRQSGKGCAGKREPGGDQNEAARRRGKRK